MIKQLNKSEIKKINIQIKVYDIALDKKDKTIFYEDNAKIILVNDIPKFFCHKERVVPTLKLLLEKPILKKVIVDMGSVKFIINGADIMRPGIKEVDDNIAKDALVMVVDEKNRKPLAVGIALFSSKEITEKENGKVIKNIHYVGDEIWKSVV